LLGPRQGWRWPSDRLGDRINFRGGFIWCPPSECLQQGCPESRRMTSRPGSSLLKKISSSIAGNRARTAQSCSERSWPSRRRRRRGNPARSGSDCICASPYKDKISKASQGRDGSDLTQPANLIDDQALQLVAPGEALKVSRCPATQVKPPQRAQSRQEPGRHLHVPQGQLGDLPQLGSIARTQTAARDPDGAVGSLRPRRRTGRHQDSISCPSPLARVTPVTVRSHRDRACARVTAVRCSFPGLWSCRLRTP
jgi:hypothetical protein